MAEESFWVERAQTAEAALTTCRDQTDRVKLKLRGMMEVLGARELSDGTIDIDFAKLAANLSPDHALELRAAIDEAHQISGGIGDKPRIVVSA
jgi:hypothetical protein